MGNQPSSPTPQAPSTSPPAVPPPPPPCDLDCQKQKQLVLLKQSLDSIDQQQDPAGYEKARIAYFTLLNGPGWLAQEKQRIASDEVEPVLSSYTQQYNALKGEQKSQSVFKSLADSLKVQQSADEESNRFLKKQLSAEKDAAAVKDRMNQLNAGTPYSPSQMDQYISWAIDIIIAILGLFVVYNVYVKFFGQSTTSPTISDLSSA